MSLRPTGSSPPRRRFYLWAKVYFALTYNQGKPFLAGRTADLCSRFGEISALKCSNVTLDAPTKHTTRAADFEIRRLFGSFGVAAHLTCNLEAKSQPPRNSALRAGFPEPPKRAATADLPLC
jgi:hypothetical protein